MSPEPAVKPQAENVTALLQAWGAGDEDAGRRLVPLVYRDLRRRAAGLLRREAPGHTLQPTALVHEAYLRLVGYPGPWRNRSQFFGVASNLMRRILVVYALEPNPGMVRLAERQRHTDVDITFIGLPGEQIPLEDGSVDTVLSTFTLCTIPGVVEALRGVRRVLKPGGKLIFFEHGLSPDPRVRRWQEWSEPIPHWLFEGCHVTRDIPSLIVQSGFRIEKMEAAYLAGFPKAWTHCWWGTAT
jgi:SAM-dependent methyltransferase